MNARTSLPRWLGFAGIAASAILLGLYARGGAYWPLGFVVLVPWLLALNQTQSLRASMLSGLLMSVAFALAVFAWFGSAMGRYTGIGDGPALLLLGLLAPLLQPQVLAFALVRHLARSMPDAPRALAAGAAWVACEWLWPKLLGDTLGHGLAAATALRQVADLGGAAGITLLLILGNEALAIAVRRARTRLRSALPALAVAAALPALMYGYGVLQLAKLRAPVDDAPSLRIGMVQSGIVDYESLRRELGTYAVVRKVLDTHFGLSRAAIEHHGADALLWSETVYPTTFAHPRSSDGAALDREILDFVDAVGVPLVFGTYDLDAEGEYNAAAFVEPNTGLLGFYRKTHPFPFTERVPTWLDSALLRRWLPWAGSWQAGSGARVFPLRARDGRVLQVTPLICLDDVRPDLALDGARLGAQAIIGLSNDSWFSSDSSGARLHLAVATFRSIETRLPQLRVTSNGLSAFVDPSGEVIVETVMGAQSVLAGAIPARNPEPTLMVQWGDWVGQAAVALLLALSLWRLGRIWHTRGSRQAPAQVLANTPFQTDVVLLSRVWRGVLVLLRLSAGAGLLVLALRMIWIDGLQVNSLAQIYWYAAAVLAPAGSAWLIQRVFAARASLHGEMLVLRQRAMRIEIPASSVARIHVWRLPLPGVGVDLEFNSGRRFAQGVQLADPHALARALATAGAARLADADSVRRADYALLRAAAAKPWLDHPLAKFLLFPLVPALPAFRLHQHIAFGGTFGEYYTYGLGAWLIGLLIWWAAWSIGLMLFAAALRVFSESCTWLALRWRPALALPLRVGLDSVLRLVFYLGVPLALLLRILAV